VKRRKTAPPKRRTAPKAVRGSSKPTHETEGARLTRERDEALEQQTATSDVLQVISSSLGQLQPVFDAMLANATRLCGPSYGTLWLHENDGQMRMAALHGTLPGAFREKWSVGTLFRPNPLEPVTVAAVELGGIRTLLAVPMLKENELTGAFTLARGEVRPFTDKEIALVTGFPAQAVIAIENVRLLNELRELNQQLEQRVTDQVGEIEHMGRLRRFLPPQVADLIVASGTEKQLESHRREITALFCDLRGFTGFTESADAEDVMALLRDYHAAIGQIIIKYSGTLERYAGDGVMVIFNDPVPVENPALQAG
jgi:adenylate cyclase